MPSLGLDCQIILDGSGYFIEPGSYRMTRLRNYAATQTPGKIVKVAGTQKGIIAVSTNGDGVGENTISFFPPFAANPTMVFGTQTPLTLKTGTSTARDITTGSAIVHITGAEAHSVVQVEWQASPLSNIVGGSALPPPAPKNSGSPHRIVDRGPYMRTWQMNVLCNNNLKKYDGTPLGNIGQQLRDQLETSYDQIATSLLFIDPSGQQYSVLFAEYTETIQDLRTQLIGIPYLAEITLIENDR